MVVLGLVVLFSNIWSSIAVKRWFLFVSWCIVKVLRGCKTGCSWLIKWCDFASDFIQQYNDLVISIESEAVLPVLQQWRLGEIGWNDSELVQLTVTAVYSTVGKIGWKAKSAAAEEAVGRQIREHLAGTMSLTELGFYHQLGVRMYFNPPANVVAVRSQFEGFL